MRIIQSYRTLIVTKSPKFKIFRMLVTQKGERKTGYIIFVYSKSDFQEITRLLDGLWITNSYSGYSLLRYERLVFDVREEVPYELPTACMIAVTIKNDRIKEVVGKIKELGYLSLLLSLSGIRILK